MQIERLYELLETYKLEEEIYTSLGNELEATLWRGKTLAIQHLIEDELYENKNTK